MEADHQLLVARHQNEESHVVSLLVGLLVPHQQRDSDLSRKRAEHGIITVSQTLAVHFETKLVHHAGCW